MKILRPFSALVLLVATTAPRLLLGAEPVSLKQPQPVLPLDQWKVSAAAGDDVRLSEKDGSLLLDYTVKVERMHHLGFETFPTGTFDLLLKKPLPLPAGSDRISYEAIGSEWKAWNARSEQTRLRPLVQDSQGKILVYNGFPNESLGFSQLHPAAVADAARWRRWETRQFQTSEAGAATQDIYEARGDGGSCFPEGALTFLGFEIEVRIPKPGQKSGQLVLGGYSLLGGKSEAEDPWVYADALCKLKGDYKLGYEVSNGFQALPIHSDSHAFSYDPENLASRRQQLSFPLGPTDNYWISYRLIAPDNSVAASDHFRIQIYDRTGPPPKLIDPSKPPAAGCLRINPVAHTDGVYQSDEPMKVTVRVFGTQQKTSPLKLKWELLTYQYPVALAQGEQTVEVAQGKFKDLVLPLTPQAGRDAYRLKLTVEEDGRAIDQALYHLGRKTVFAVTEHPRPIPLCDRTFIKDGTYNRVTITKLGSTVFKSEDEYVKYYVDRLDEVRKITPFVTYVVDVRDLQALPGVFNFVILDRLMDAAAARGMAATIRFDHVDDEGEFTWMKYARQVNYDGHEIPEHFYGGFSVTDKKYTQVWLDDFRAVYNRYGSHPAFQGYYLLLPSGEFSVADKPWEGLISGYSPPEREAFREWLQESRGYSLEQLNARWKTSYAKWDEVQPPQPDFSLGQEPDLRTSWVDFCRFKAWLDKDYWQKRAITAIRAFDPWRVVISYSDPRKAEGLADYGQNGGNHFFENIGSYMNTWYEHQTGWITEPHQPNKWADYGDPKERGWVLDWSIWIAIAQAGGGGANLHVYYHPRLADLLSHFGGDMGYDRMQRYFPILQELHDMDMTLHPTEVVFLCDPSTLYSKHRTTFLPRMLDMKRWGELLDRDNVSYQRVTGDLAEKDLQGVKLIVCNVLDEVLSGTNVAALDKAVREGGAKLMITANTGKYSPETPDEKFVLLRKLGIEPPEGDYVVQDTNVKAAATGGANPLFDQGEAIRFFSLADLKSELDSELIKKQENFFAYPYRWLPLTDYFGYYPKSQGKGGTTLATFANGAPAVSLYSCGKGEVVVFWGLPDNKHDNLPGFMARLARWAGSEKSVSSNPLPFMREGTNAKLGRHYALVYNDNAGTFHQKIEFLTDGDWFVDEMVSDQRLGKVSGKTARERGLDLTFDPSYSPLKILRFIPMKNILTKNKWQNKYGDLDQTGASQP